jgi:hypothetical protein
MQTYDIGRYLVPSDSGQDDYLVDVIEHWCDCCHFRIRVDGLGEASTCKHIERAQAKWARDFNPEERAAILRQQKVK